jgi:signal transduction histidine kinase
MTEVALTAVVAHSLLNVTSVIRGAAELLREVDPDDSERIVPILALLSGEIDLVDWQIESLPPVEGHRFRNQAARFLAAVGTLKRWTQLPPTARTLVVEDVIDQAGAVADYLKALVRGLSSEQLEALGGPPRS